MAFATASALLFVVLSSVLGVRLVRRFRGEGRGPEAFVGLSFLSSSVGILASFAALVPEVQETAVRWLAALGSVALLVAGGAVLCFLRLVFRPDGWVGRVGATILGGAAVALGAWMMHHAATAPIETLREAGVAMLLPNALLGTILAWVAVEALLCWGRLQRQAALGLAEPVLVNRMFLYAIGSSLSALLLTSGVVPSVAWGIDPLQDPVLQVISGVLGMPIGVVYFLALTPPRAYERWITEHAAR